MSHTRHSNGFDSRENHRGDYRLASPCSSNHGYPLIDPAMLLQDYDEGDVNGLHIVLTCGPQDDEEDDK